MNTATQSLRSSQISTSNVTTADVAFAPDGRTLVTGESVTGLVSPPPEVMVLRDAADGNELARSQAIPAGRLAGLTMDGQSVLVSSGGARSHLLDARTLRQVKRFATGGGGAVSPTADIAAFGHDDGTVTIVDLATGQLRELIGHAGAGIQALGFSANDNVLASADADGSVAVWNLASASLGEVFRGHSTAASGVALSPDGKTIYSASFDGSVLVWDVTGERRLGQLFGFDPVGPAARAAASVRRPRRPRRRWR